MTTAAPAFTPQTNEPNEVIYFPAIDRAKAMGCGAHPKEIALFILDLAKKLKPLHDILTGSQAAEEHYIPKFYKLHQIIGAAQEYDTVREAAALMLYHFSIYRFGILEEAQAIVTAAETLDEALEEIEKGFALKDGASPQTPALAGLL